MLEKKIIMAYTLSKSLKTQMFWDIQTYFAAETFVLFADTCHYQLLLCDGKSRISGTQMEKNREKTNTRDSVAEAEQIFL